MSGKVIMVVDAQGGGLGRQLITQIRKENPMVRIIATGTNSVASAAMLKAGANEVGTGENAVIASSRRADIIIGPVGMVIADSMTGEITPAMACAVAQARAQRILIPFSHCDNYIAGLSECGMGRLLADALGYLKKLLTEE